MPYNPTIHNRHSIRLPGYDYTQPGAYYLTILTHKKEHLFGKVVDGIVQLSPVGEVVQEEWLKIPTNFSNVALDAFVIMPNHLHGIVVITDSEVRSGKGKGKAFEKRGTQKVHSTSSYSIHYNKSANMDSNALPIRDESGENAFTPTAGQRIRLDPCDRPELQVSQLSKDQQAAQDSRFDHLAS